MEDDRNDRGTGQGVVEKDFLSENVWRALILASAVAVLLFSVYCLSHGITIIFMHLYYFPIVLLAYRYRWKGFGLAMLLAIAYIGLVYFYNFGQADVIVGAWYRFIVFVSIAAVVAYLSEQLKESETLLNEVGEMAHVGGWELDVRTKEVHWTKETYRIHDISEDKKFDLSKAILFFDLPGRSTLEAALQRCMETGEPFDLELPFTSAKGMHLITRAKGRAVKSGGMVVKLTGTFQNITDFARVEEALHESENRYRNLYESSHDAIMTIEPPLWGFTSGNPATLKLFVARDEAEFTSKEPWALSPTLQPDGRDSGGKAKEMIETAMRNGTHFFEWTHRRLNGEDFPATVLLSKVELAGKVFIQATVRDITEQKRAELQAKERMKELQAFYGLAGLTERKGITLDQLYQEFTNLLPKSWQYNEIAYSRIVIGDSEFRTNNFRESAWKQSAPVRVHGSVVGKIEVGYLEERPELDEGPFLKEERALIDALSERLGRIIERVRTEKALRETKERFRTMVDWTYDMEYWIDQNKDIVYISPSSGRITGYSADEFITDKGLIDRIVHPDDRTPWEEHIQIHSQDEGGKKPLDVEFRIIAKDGTIRWISHTCRAIFADDGRWIGRRISNRDITEHKHAEEKLKSSEELYKALIETTGTGYVIIDTDGRVLDANPEYVHLTGYHTLEEIIGRSVVEWTAGYEVEKNAEAVKKCARDGYIRNLEIDYADLNGKITPVEINATVVQLQRTTKILTLCRDITERKQAEEKLKFSNVLLSTEQDVSIDGILVVDESGKIISFNRRFIEIWGIPQDVVASRSDERALRSVIDKLADPEEFLARVNELYANRDEKSREEILLKDGRVLDRYSAPMSGSDGKYYGRVWNFRDITEQKLIEEVLRESEERYRILSEASPDMIFMVGRDDTIKFANTALLKLFRLPYDQVVGTPRKNLFPPDIADAQGTLLKKVFETGELVKKEEKFRFGTQELWIDTSSVPIKDAAGNVTAVLGIAHDITDRKRIEERLRENEIRYRSLFEGAGEGILVADIDTQKFLHANPAMFRMLGYSEEELFTLGVGDIHPKESLDYVISEFMAQARGEKLMAENLPVLRKDKSIFYADVSSTRILIDEKMCNVGFFSDITERKKSEDILKRFNEELEQQVKSRTVELNVSLKEKEGLLKEIHHRVRNNLQIVSSIISLQAKSVSDPGSLHQIQEIRMRIGTLALVHEIAYLAKTPESINMRDFLHRCTSKVIDEFKCEPGRINITITAENIQVALNQAVPCSLIVNELLMNSVRHAFPHKRHGEIKIGFSIARGNFVLEYGDDGIGFPEGMHPQQAETGGMSLIQGLARQIRGTVESTTRPGTGYTLTFPAGTGGT